MKTNFVLTYLISVLVIANTAFAAEIPNCWNESGKPVQDGAFSVGLNSKDATAKQLVSALDLASDRYTIVKNYPLVFDPTVIVLIEAVDYGIGSSKLSREALKAEVQKQLEKIIATGIVDFIECDGTDVGPYPGSTVHN